MYQNDGARQANKKLASDRSLYEYTTAPLLRVDNTLREIKDILAEILKRLDNPQQG